MRCGGYHGARRQKGQIRRLTRGGGVFPVARKAYDVTSAFKFQVQRDRSEIVPGIGIAEEHRAHEFPVHIYLRVAFRKLHVVRMVSVLGVVGVGKGNGVQSAFRQGKGEIERVFLSRYIRFVLRIARISSFRGKRFPVRRFVRVLAVVRCRNFGARRQICSEFGFDRMGFAARGTSRR